MTGQAQQNGHGARVTDTAELARVQAEILRALREVKFGSVEIVIHDSRVVQIERREKTRFTA